MTDHDDKVTRRYRELAREEPGAALDAAILAASRRAVTRRSAASRWGPPLSIAAVLMLAVGVTLNIQHEQPGVEYSEPSRPSAPPPAAKPVPEMTAPAPQVAPVQSPRREDAQPALRARKAAPSTGSREENFVPSPPPAKSAADRVEPAIKEKKDTALSDLSVARTESRAFSAPRAEPPASPPATISTPAAASAPAAAPVAKTRDTAEMLQNAPAQAPAEPARAKREGDSRGATSLRVQSAIVDPAQELERIARLRAEGRHADADKALEEFRRRHPGFKIPEAMWERVKPPATQP